MFLFKVLVRWLLVLLCTCVCTPLARRVSRPSESPASAPSIVHVIRNKLARDNELALELEALDMKMFEEELEMTSAMVGEDHKITNIALNSTVRLSSSADSNPRYAMRAVDGNPYTFVETAIERTIPYLIVDLGVESYIDEVTILSPLELGDVLTFTTDSRAVAFTRNVSEKLTNSNLVNWHASAFVSGSQITFHTHASGRYVRIQRMSVSQLVVSEVIIQGVKLTPKEKPLSQCLSGHDGGTICSGRGACSKGHCHCGTFYSGHRCEHIRLSVISFGFTCIIVFSALLSFSRKCKHVAWKLLPRYSGFSDLANRLSLSRKDPSCLRSHLQSCQFDEESMQENDPKRYLVVNHMTPEESQAPMTNRKRSSGYDHIEMMPLTPDEEEEKFQPYKLHVLFASPLVMMGDARELVEVSQLDVERECNMLSRSLTQANAQRRIQLEVSCATIESLRSILTLRQSSVLHVSSHCHLSGIALEDDCSSAHLVSTEGLGNLLIKSRPALESSRLVVLNSCHSEGVANAFVRAGFAHVVALRANERVRDDTSITFTKAFYLALASYHTVFDAFQIAKEAVSLNPLATPGEDGAFVLLPEDGDHDEVVWPNSTFPVPSTSHVSLFHNPAPIPSPLKDFVGRATELWTIQSLLQRHQMINIHGDKGSGKSSLVVQLANHIRLRRGEHLYPDGVFFLPLDSNSSHEDLCSFLANYVTSEDTPTSSRSPSPVSTPPVTSSMVVKRGCSQKFAQERPNSLVIVDGISSELLESKVFQDSINAMVNTSSKLRLVTVSNVRLNPTLNAVNLLCGRLSDLDSARLFIRLCHPRVIPTDPRRGLEEMHLPLDDFETIAFTISENEQFQGLAGNCSAIRRLASKINSQASHGDVITLEYLQELV